MCAISGIYAPAGLSAGDHPLCDTMSAAMRHRGPDGSGAYDDELCALRHERLAVMDPRHGAQPMTCAFGGRRYVLVYNGELYNTAELTRDLCALGFVFHTACDTERLLYAYAAWGEACLERLTGIFAFAVWCPEERTLFCARDRLGVKPFFFARRGGRFLFASEPKGLLPALGRPRIDAVGLWQLLFLSPVTLPGSGLFAGVEALLPGECMTVSPDGVSRRRYWRITAEEHTESREETVLRTRDLLRDAVRSQLDADVPLSTLLSGGLDSSVVSSVAAQTLRERGERLSTYSFEYRDNDYAPTLFQPNRDDDYARRMAAWIASDHTVLTVGTDSVAACLGPATLARDFPGQADIDSSLLWFCRQIRRRHTVSLSGECADEIFGGYPWFYRPEMLGRDFFPWIHDPFGRLRLFDPAAVRADEGCAFLRDAYRVAVADAPVREDDSPADRTARVASHLSMTFFMASLLERKDRMSMASGLEVRVPFADHRLAQYVCSVPWSIRFEGGVEKALLRAAAEPYLPPEILCRKKSPYPKTHNPAYEELVHGMLLRRLRRPDSRLAPLLRDGALSALEEGEDATWFGQLMARAQLYAWLWQFDYWLETYDVEIAL